MKFLKNQKKGKRDEPVTREHTSKYFDGWLIGYQESIKYYEKNGNLSVKTKYKTDEGYALGTWISMQKSRKKQNKLSHEQIEKLEKLGICWYTELDE